MNKSNSCYCAIVSEKNLNRLTPWLSLNWKNGLLIIKSRRKFSLDISSGFDLCFNTFQKFEITSNFQTVVQLASDVENLGNRAACDDTPSNIDIILSEISSLQPFIGPESGENFILALEEILSPENLGNRTDFDRSYLLDIWEKAGGEKNLFNPCVKPPA